MVVITKLIVIWHNFLSSESLLILQYIYERRLCMADKCRGFNEVSCEPGIALACFDLEFQLTAPFCRHVIL